MMMMWQRWDVQRSSILWDLSHPTKRLSYPVPLSCPLRVYISVAPQLTPTYPLEPIYPLGSTWASCQVQHKMSNGLFGPRKS